MTKKQLRILLKKLCNILIDLLLIALMHLCIYYLSYNILLKIKLIHECIMHHASKLHNNNIFDTLYLYCDFDIIYKFTI